MFHASKILFYSQCDISKFAIFNNEGSVYTANNLTEFPNHRDKVTAVFFMRNIPLQR